MKEIKAGYYVRIDGYITKIKSVSEWKEKHKFYISYDLPGCDCASEVTEKFKIKKDIIGLLEENDLLSIEYYSPRYEERVTRLFEVDYKDDEYIVLENSRCTFQLKNGEYSVFDKKLNPIIKDVVTKEQFNSVKYKVE